MDSFLIYIVSPVLIGVFLYTSLQAATLLGAVPLRSRVSNIDGLRGLLALGVLFHHFSVFTEFGQSGEWTDKHRIWNILGQGAVSLFFMITGYLFFMKVDKSGGRIDLLKFFTGRVLRIYPVYIACFAAVALIAALSTSVWPSDPTVIVKQFIRWMAFGNGPLFGVGDAGQIIGYVPWTLRYEWLFYLTIPALALLRARTPLFVPASFVMLAVALYFVVNPVSNQALGLQSIQIAPFVIGGIAYIVSSTIQGRPFYERPVVRGAGFLVFFSAIVYYMAMQGTAYSFVSYICLGCIFGGVVMMRPVLILTSDASRAMGQISYDMYLVHAIVMYVFFQFDWDFNFSDSPVAATLGLLVVGVVTIIISSLLHVSIEAPAIKLSGHASGLWAKGAKWAKVTTK